MSNGTKDITVSLGGGFCGLLTILFVGLKLTNYIDWSWWWILAPMWMPTAFALAIVAVVATAIVILHLLEKVKK